MSFSKAYYGAESPSLARRLTVQLMTVTLVAAFYGGWADFIPAEVWSRTGRFIAIGASAVCSPVLIFAHATGKIRAKIQQGTSALLRAVCYLLIPLFLFGFFWLAVVHGVGASVTSLLGAKADVALVARKEFRRSSRSCDFRLKATELRRALPPYLCLSETQYTTLPEESEISLHGRKSTFGFMIDSWQIKTSAR